MSNKACGYECPKCASLGPHNVQWWDWRDEKLVGLGLSCHSCEHVWAVDLR